MQDRVEEEDGCEEGLDSWEGEVGDVGEARRRDSDEGPIESQPLRRRKRERETSQAHVRSTSCLITFRRSTSENQLVQGFYIHERRSKTNQLSKATTRRTEKGRRTSSSKLNGLFLPRSPPFPSAPFSTRTAPSGTLTSAAHLPSGARRYRARRVS